MDQNKSSKRSGLRSTIKYSKIKYTISELYFSKVRYFQPLMVYKSAANSPAIKTAQNIRRESFLNASQQLFEAIHLITSID